MPLLSFCYCWQCETARGNELGSSFLMVDVFELQVEAALSSFYVRDLQLMGAYECYLHDVLDYIFWYRWHLVLVTIADVFECLDLTTYDCSCNLLKQAHLLLA